MSTAIDRTLLLEEALLIFGNSDSAVVCRASAHTANGQVLLGNPVRVTDDIVNALLERTRRGKKAASLSVLGAHILAHAPDNVAWFIPACKRELLFQAHGTGTGLSGLTGKAIPQPPLVMVASPAGLRVYAVAENIRPSEKTLLCAAPYFNVHANHQVCLGSMRVPDQTGPGTTHLWEASFYGSNFTHSSSPGRWPSKWTHLELWQAAVQAGHFDPAWLTPLTSTLADALGKNL